ncbi:tail fiber assembly protein [Enterobacter asburiae]|uniref:tail fiber assembly protein n=1 Tax=Enterobacter asburiae TaxID=61645 RepID=UPI002A828DA1|nr:tail fiber assembly protein [Enterobacter asburiae]
MILGEFSNYIPSEESKLSDLEMMEKLTGSSIIFLKDENDVDWYDAQKLFAKDTLKVVFDGANVIRSFSTDASMLNPVDMSVGECDISDVPAGLNIFGEWIFDGGKIIAAPVDYVDEAQRKKLELMTQANNVIATMQDAVDLNMATDEETANLQEWKKYRVLLNRVDVKKPVWPPLPETAI